MNRIILNYKFNMWRFFRLGVKSNNVCPGNQAHFRIIGATCANTDCDDVEDVNCSSSKKDLKACKNKENLATVASKRFHQTLQAQENAEFKQRERRNDVYKSFGAFNKPILRENSQNQFKYSKNNYKYKQTSNVRKISEKDLDFSVKDEGIEDIKFGALSEPTRKSELLPDDPDDKTILLPRCQAQSYGRIMLELCKGRKIKEALHVLEVEMKSKEVAPDSYCYNVLINACGKMGYAEKALELYHQMKKRGLRIEKFAYTGLFNSFANSPMKSKSLEFATTLRKQLKDKEVVLHPITYHAMIKAFGHCGDIKTAFEIVDEMVYDGLPVNAETLTFLLQACLTDKETGFRHALMVWRKLRILLITPSIYSYNMLLRCLRDCAAGDPQLLSEFLDDMLESHKIKGKLKRIRDKKHANAKKYLPSSHLSSKTKPDQNVIEGEKNDSTYLVKGGEEKEEFCQIDDGNEVVKVNLKPNMELEIVSPEKDNSSEEVTGVLPNVLSYKVQPGSIIAISSLDKKEERMWLLGGITGIMNSMLEDGVKPNIITFNTILESLPSNLEVEEALLSTMENSKVQPDVIFCNKLIQKRCSRNSLEEAKDVLTLMQKHSIEMDIVSYGCLALGCQKPSDIRHLLRDMKKNSIIPNESIMNVLVLNSVKRFEFALAVELLLTMKRLNVPIKEDLLRILERSRYVIRKKFVEFDAEGPGTVLTKREERIREEMRLFLCEYKHWLKTSEVELKEHPWAQFGYSEKEKVVAKKS